MRIDISEKDWRRIVATVLWAEGFKKESPTTGRRGVPILPNRNALITTAISARSGTTKGHGVVTLYQDDQTGTGNMTVLQTGVTCWNTFGTAAPAGKWAVTGIVDGLLEVYTWEC